MAFQSWSTSRRSASVSQGSSDSRRSGLSAMPSRIVRKWPTIRLHRLGLEQILVVAQHPLDGAVPLLERHLQIGLARVLLDVILLDLQAAHGELGPGRRQEKAPRAELLRAMRLLEREGDLHQRRAAGIALDLQPLHQQGERIVLVLQGVEHGGADAPEQGGEGRVARQVGAEGQHVDEVADHVLEPGRLRPANGQPTRKSSWPV